jgi:hypothetical protein
MPVQKHLWRRRPDPLRRPRHARRIPQHYILLKTRYVIHLVPATPSIRSSTPNIASAHRRQDRLPTMFGPGPFCQSCRSNQNLVLNLLSNYLPAQDVRRALPQPPNMYSVLNCACTVSRIRSMNNVSGICPNTRLLFTNDTRLVRRVSYVFVSTPLNLL